MFEAVWGGLLGGFGHTVFYPVNPNPPQATSTHLTHLYLTLPYYTRVVGEGGWGFEAGLGCFGMVSGVLGCFYGPIHGPRTFQRRSDCYNGPMYNAPITD